MYILICCILNMALIAWLDKHARIVLVTHWLNGPNSFTLNTGYFYTWGNNVRQV
jgi:hypothetical protein